MAHLQASTVLRQANTAAHRRVSTEVPHQDRASMARHPHKANMAPLLQANTELHHQVNMVSDRRRVVLVDTQVSSSTASHRQVASTSTELLAKALATEVWSQARIENRKQECVKEQ